jgi:hypothetical protein
MAAARAYASTGLVAVALVIGLAGCTAAPMPAPTPSASASAPIPEPTETVPAVPHRVPSGTAEENKPYFDLVNNEFYTANGMSDGRSIIDNLVAAGFPKSDMEVTPDRTSIDLAADSIIFSVRVKGECLLGQVSVRGYTSVVGPLLGTGGCLVGATRPIDW